MSEDEQRAHQEERLRALTCDKAARWVAWLYWGMWIMPPAAYVFADEKVTVIFEWEKGGCTVELRISAGAQSTTAATAPAVVTAPCGCSVTSGYRCPVHQQP